MPKQIHFIGAGGVGVSGLAHLALDAGYAVSASDIADSGMLATLRARGVSCVVGHVGTLPEGTDTVVFSSAVPDSDPERQFAAAHGIRQVRRGDFLAELAEHFGYRVAVSGSHGKTTTTAMIAHILRLCGREPGYLVGGTVNGWERAAAAGNGSILVSEVDESDGSQAGFPADLALVMNIDDDHSWALGGTSALEECFVKLCRHVRTGVGTPSSLPRRVLCWESAATRSLFGDWPEALFLNRPLVLSELTGEHNRINGAMAVEAACLCGIERSQAMEALRSFPGVSRRLSIRAQNKTCTLLEDYAHHPTELAASLQALLELFPGKPLLVAFQPHRNERVERYGVRFGQLLAQADWIGLTPAFGAWRTDGQTCDVNAVIGQFLRGKYAYLNGTWEENAAVVCQEAKAHPGCVIAVIGAGDITRLVPYLKSMLEG